MATIEDAIYTVLTTNPSVGAIVSTRVYRVKMPDNSPMPTITYQTTYGSSIESFNGDSGLQNPIISIDCWADSAGAVSDLARKVKAALHGYTGTIDDVRIENVLEWSSVDLYDSETEIFHVSCSARFWYY